MTQIQIDLVWILGLSLLAVVSLLLQRRQK
jgi:hypothetical protein